MLRRKLFALPCNLLLLCVLLSTFTAHAQNSQSYLNDTGSTSYGVNIPVENGFIDVSNGNLHLEFPIASHPQRGALSLNERLVYDSRIWMFSPFGTHGSYHWWPTNVYGSAAAAGGWRFINGNETGSISYTSAQSSKRGCVPVDPVQGMHYYDITYADTYTWVDPSGTSHSFGGPWLRTEDTCDTLSPVPESRGGTATDGSGYTISFTGDTLDDPTSITIKDSSGTQVYPGIIDRYGNYWSSDGQGNLVDDTGRVPVIATQSGNVTYYDVLSPNGPINNNGKRVRYTVTTALVPVATSFNQSDTYELDWPQYPGQALTLNPVQSILLPDGSQYSFTYDTYGELASVTLPTGGVVHYGYINFLDSANTENRWLSSRTVGSDPPLTITPMVGTTCTNYATGCKEYTIVKRPSTDSTLYEMTLVNGAWNTGTYVYTGTIPVYTGTIPRGEPGVKPLLFTTTTYQYSNPCSGPACTGANIAISSLATTELFTSGTPSVYTQSQATFDSGTGKTTSVKEWDYSSNITNMNTSAPPATLPAREVDYTYTGLDPYQITVLDSAGHTAGLTTYTYTTSATATTGVTGHSTQNAGGPYVQSVAHWINTDPTHPATTTYVMDDTGEVRSIVDANQNPATTLTYQCNNSLPYTGINPLGQTTSYGYDCGSGQLLSVRDPNDLAVGRSGTIYTYEAVAGRLYTATTPDNGVTTYTYPAIGEVDTTVLATPDPAVVSKSIADSFGRPFQQITGNVATDTTYDVNGRRYCVSNPYTSTGSPNTGPSTCFTTYDGLDRPITVTEADSNTRTSSYASNATTTLDEMGVGPTQTVDAFGRITSVIEPAPGGNVTTSYAYDGLGYLSSIAQTGNPTLGETPRNRYFTYDSLGSLRQSYSPEAGWICYGTTAAGVAPNGTNCNSDGYDKNGNLLYKTDATGMKIGYTYDALNRTSTKTGTDAGMTAFSYVYDQGVNGIGQLTSVSNPGLSSTSFTYDSMGRVASELPYYYFSGAGPGVATQYDLAGNLTQLTYPDNRVVGQAWDGNGNLAAVWDKTTGGPGTVYFSGASGTGTPCPVGVPASYCASYDPSGALVSAQLGNGVVQSTLLNNRLQPCHIYANSPVLGAAAGLGNIYDRELSYSTAPVAPPPCSPTLNNNGLITSIINVLQSDHTQSFSYDTLNRLTTAFQSNGDYNHTYSYDSFGNMLPHDIVHGSLNYSIDNGSQPTNRMRLNVTDLQYSANGSLASSPSHSYSFTGEGFLRSIDNYGTGSYLNNGLGERTLADRHGLGTWNEYVYLNGQAMADLDNTGKWSDYIYANGQKIAKVDSTDTRVHLTAVNAPGSGDWGLSNLPVPANATIQAGDVLSFRMYEHNATATTSLGFTDGSNSDWYCGICYAPIGGVSDQWVNASIAVGGSVASPGPMVNKTFSYFFVGQRGGSSGEYDVMIADIALVHPDGSVVPFPVPLGNVGFGGFLASTTGASGMSEVVSSASITAIGAVADTHYYLSDHLGTAQMELSSGGWPIWQGQFTPFGQEIIGGTTTNYLGPQPADGTAMRYRFAGLEKDQESGLDHAEARQLASVEGRWISPDPYDGSMDLGNPQSLNRYAYVNNRPLTFTDPSGLFPLPCGFNATTADGVTSVALGSGIGAWVALGACAGEAIWDIAKLFEHPKFTASATPRPWNEHLGLPAGGHLSNGTIGGILGLGNKGCEFGACGGGTQMGLFPGNGPSLGGKNTIPGQFFEGLGVIWDTYKEMEAAWTKGDDKFFHCTAMARATNLGPGGRAAAVTASWGREAGDQVKYQVERLWGKGMTVSASWQDSKEDLQADYTGINWRTSGGCKQYRVRGLP